SPSNTSWEPKIHEKLSISQHIDHQGHATSVHGEHEDDLLTSAFGLKNWSLSTSKGGLDGGIKSSAHDRGESLHLGASCRFCNGFLYILISENGAIPGVIPARNHVPGL